MEQPFLLKFVSTMLKNFHFSYNFLIHSLHFLIIIKVNSRYDGASDLFHRFEKIKKVYKIRKILTFIGSLIMALVMATHMTSTFEWQVLVFTIFGTNRFEKSSAQRTASCTNFCRCNSDCSGHDYFEGKQIPRKAKINYNKFK